MVFFVSMTMSTKSFEFIESVIQTQQNIFETLIISIVIKLKKISFNENYYTIIYI